MNSAGHDAETAVKVNFHLALNIAGHPSVGAGIVRPRSVPQAVFHRSAEYDRYRYTNASLRATAACKIQQDPKFERLRTNP